MVLGRPRRRRPDPAGPEGTALVDGEAGPGADAAAAVPGDSDPKEPARQSGANKIVYRLAMPSTDEAWPFPWPLVHASREGNSDAGDSAPQLEAPWFPPPGLDPESWSTPATEPHPEPAATTLVVRNIPAQYTTSMLLEEWSCEGTYDYLYLPRNCAVRRNLNYAFVNFVSEECAAAFREKWHKARLARFRAQKTLNIGLANVQGFEENISRLEQKRRFCAVPGCQCVPVVLKDGHRVPLSSVSAAMAKTPDHFDEQWLMRSGDDVAKEVAAAPGAVFAETS